MDIKALVVDDEQLAREELCYLLGQAGGVTVVAQAANGPDALAAIEAHEPDLVFLDVQMPGLGGFDVLERVSGTHLPVVIFVTAYDQYALKAFDVPVNPVAETVTTSSASVAKITSVASTSRNRSPTLIASRSGRV
jgi:DNA-binding LytR/AlgR family response regulator